MLSIGISISRNRIDAVALDGTGSAVRVAATAERACTEPFGDAQDAVARRNSSGRRWGAWRSPRR